MGGPTYIPNPPGTLPYRGTSQGFAQGFEQVAATLADYYKRKRELAAQTVDMQLKLMQAGLGGDTKKLIKSAKTLGISLDEEAVKNIGVQARQRAAAETQQAQAQAQETQAKARMAQLESKLTTTATSPTASLEEKRTSQQQLMWFFGRGPSNLFQAMTPEQQQEAIKREYRGQIVQTATQLQRQYDPATAMRISEWMYTGGEPPAGVNFGRLTPEQINDVTNVTSQFVHIDGTPVTTAEATTAVQTGTLPSNWISLSKQQAGQQLQLRQQEFEQRKKEFVEGVREFNAQQGLRETQAALSEAEKQSLIQERTVREGEIQRLEQDRQAGKVIATYRALMSATKDADRRTQLSADLVNELHKMGYTTMTAEVVSHWFRKNELQLTGAAPDVDKLLRGEQ